MKVSTRVTKRGYIAKITLPWGEIVHMMHYATRELALVAGAREYDRRVAQR